MRKFALTAGDLLKRIQTLKKEGNITNKTKIVYSHDDEGNMYQACVMVPSVIYTKKDISYGMYLDTDELVDSCPTHTFLCIN